MSNKIKLSEKYGVNPTIPLCFWCGNERDAIAFLGHIGDGRKGEDFEAPISAVLDYEPCDICKENMNKGVTLIEVSESCVVKTQPPIRDSFYPTSRWCVISQELAERIFGTCETKIILVDNEIYNKLFEEEPKNEQ